MATTGVVSVAAAMRPLADHPGFGLVRDNSADERRVRCAPGDRHNGAFDRADIQLTRAEEPGFRIGDHLVPMCDPANGARHGKDRGEHRHRQAQRAKDDAGVEIDIGVELALAL